MSCEVKNAQSFLQQSEAISQLSQQIKFQNV